MLRAWPPCESRAGRIFSTFSGIADSPTRWLRRIRWRERSLQRFEKPLRGILSQVADNRGEQIAILAESDMSESIRHVVDRGLGHQAEDIPSCRPPSGTLRIAFYR